MGQVSRKSYHNPPNVRSRCILVKLYKAKKHLDQGDVKIRRENKKREKPSYYTFFLELNQWMNT